MSVAGWLAACLAGVPQKAVAGRGAATTRRAALVVCPATLPSL